MKTYPIIPSTKEIQKGVDGLFSIFGEGNQKRDLVLLVRGDISVEMPRCVSFFGCVHCGYMATGTAGFHKIEKNGCKVIVCTHCDVEGGVYYFDGIWKGSFVRIEEGVKDSKVTVSKM